MSLTGWIKDKFSKPAKEAFPACFVATVPAKTRDNVVVKFEIEAYTSPPNSVFDAAMTRRMVMTIAEADARRAVSSRTLEEFRKAPGNVCEDMMGTMKPHLSETFACLLTDIAMSKITAEGLSLPPVAGRASTAAAEREKAAQQEAADKQLVTQGLPGRVQVGKPLFFKKR